jgi:hypothetical protein
MKNEQLELGEKSQDEEFSFHEDYKTKKDYSYLTIDQLKFRLVAMNVELDMQRHTKNFYLDLYTEALKDDQKRELIKGIMEKDQKLPHRKNKKPKACDNFMKNKRKRTEEEDTTKEEENNLNLINRIEENQRHSIYVKSQDINEIHVYDEDKDINKIETITPEKVFTYKKIKIFSISPSNLSTPAIKETPNIYRNIDSSKFQQQVITQNLDQLNLIKKFNPLVRTLDADFSKEGKPVTPTESPYRIKIQKFDNFRNNFTFNRIARENELDHPEREGSFILVNEEEEMPENPISPQLIADMKQPLTESFYLETGTIPCPPEEIRLLEPVSSLKDKFLNVAKYLTLVSGGAAVVLGLYYVLEETKSLGAVVDFLSRINLDRNINILVASVVAVGVVFLITYLIKASREAVKRNEEITADNIVNGVKENLLKKIESGESNPAIDQEEFTQEFCKTNNYKVSYFMANIMPIVKDYIKNDHDITNSLEENSFYDDGKLRTIWQIKPSIDHLADME